MADMRDAIESISEFIERSVTAAGAKGVVLGVSGGLDSAVVLGLCKIAFPDNTLGVISPCHSDPIDKQYALLVIEKFGVEYVEVRLDDVYDAFLRAAGGTTSRLALGNVKARLRMITNYYYANQRNYLVVGTGNKAELTMGYFTKYGDGGVDILPIGHLTKTEVRQMAALLGVPEEIIKRPPTAGLWPGQTDESEMGITYDELDSYLVGREVRPEIREMIERRKRVHAHKLRPPDLPPSADH